MLALVLFFLAMLVNRQATKSKFIEFFSALSIVKIVTLVIVIISFAGSASASSGLVINPYVLSHPVFPSVI